MSSIPPIGQTPAAPSISQQDQVDTEQTRALQELFDQMQHNPELFVQLGILQNMTVEPLPPSPTQKRARETESHEGTSSPQEKHRRSDDESQPEPHTSPLPNRDEGGSSSRERKEKVYSVRRPWTPEEIDIALQNQQRYPNHWAWIALQIPGRTAKAVQGLFTNRPELLEKAKTYNRWAEVRDDLTMVVKKPWTEAENRTLLKLYKQHSKDVQKTVTAFGKEQTVRQEATIRAHLYYLLAQKDNSTPPKKQTEHQARPFTPEEDERLFDIVKSYKSTHHQMTQAYWEQAADNMKRSIGSVQGRYFKLLRQRK